MRIPPFLPAFVLAAALSWGQQTAAAPGSAPAAADPVILTVGDLKLTQSEFERVLEQATQPQNGQPRPSLTQEAKRKLAENLAELIALAQEARKQKMDQNPEVKMQLLLSGEQILARALFQQINSKLAADEVTKRAYYNEHKSEYESVTARHILIRMKGSPVPLKPDQKDLTDEEALAKAKDLRAKIVAGGNFEELARIESDDTGSGSNGGELGDFTRGRMVPQFEEAAFALKAGDVSEPVKTQFGYHVIQVQKHETKKYEDVESEIDEKVKPELAQKAIDEVKAKTSITFDKTYFGR
jgi:peptidyl-prolyl cis-trans isomerase C